MLKFVKDKWDFFFGGCTIAWGIGFLRYIDNGYWYFPAFPNFLDVWGLVLVGSYLLVKSLRDQPPSVPPQQGT